MTHTLGNLVLACLAAAATREPYALVDYPNYLNPGDAAIWLGARRALQELNARPPAYCATLRDFSARQCLKAIGKQGVVYFTGGGNFGDMYPRHQRLRLDVLRRMPDNPIVQLPQSGAWAEATDGDLIAETIDLYRHRPSLLFFARDAEAHKALLERCGIESRLCPDLCHLLDFSTAAPRQDRLWLMRRDRERKGAAVDRGASTDWPDSAWQHILNKMGKMLLAIAPLSRQLALQDWIAAQKVQSAVAILARADTVVTDRLHAALLAGAIGRKVVLCDNSTGKLTAYFRTWNEMMAEGMRLSEDCLELAP